MLRALLSILLLATTLNVMAANPASPSTTPLVTPATTQNQSLEEDINKLQLEVGILASKMDAFDGKQANQIALLSNQSSQLGSLISAVSILIAILALAAGFFVHRSNKDHLDKFKNDAEAEITKLKETKSNAERELKKLIIEFEEQIKNFRIAQQEQIENNDLALNKKISKIDSQKPEVVFEKIGEIQASNNNYKQPFETDLPIKKTYPIGQDLLAKAMASFAERDYYAAISTCNKAFDSELGNTNNNVLAGKFLFVKATSQHQLKNLGEAIKTYQQTIRLLKDSTDHEARKILAKSIVNCGACQSQSGDDKAAIATYSQADVLIKDSDSPELRLYKAGALFNTGVSFKNLQQFDKAIHAYQQVIERYGNDENRDVQQRAVEAAVNMAEAYKKLRNYGQAIQVYLEAIKRGDDKHDLHITLGLENTLSSLEYRLSLEGQISTLGQITEHYQNDSHPEIQRDLAYIMHKLGLVHERNEPSKQQAIATLEKLINRFDNIANCKTIVSLARKTLGFIFLMQAKQANSNANKNTLLTKAISILAAALSSCRDEERAFIAGNLGYAHFLQGHTIEAEQYTRDCLQQGGKVSYAAQQNDAKQHRLEAQDNDYEAMLHRLWQDIQHAPDAEQTEPPPAG